MTPRLRVAHASTARATTHIAEATHPRWIITPIMIACLPHDCIVVTDRKAACRRPTSDATPARRARTRRRPATAHIAGNRLRWIITPIMIAS